MITYLCNKCGFDFAITELHKPKCFYCGSSKDWKIVKKQKINMKVMAERMKLVNDRLMSSLKGAYEVGKKDDDFNEDVMLDVMSRAKKLGKQTNSLLKSKKK